MAASSADERLAGELQRLAVSAAEGKDLNAALGVITACGAELLGLFLCCVVTPDIDNHGLLIALHPPRPMKPDGFDSAFCNRFDPTRPSQFSNAKAIEVCQALGLDASALPEPGLLVVPVPLNAGGAFLLLLCEVTRFPFSANEMAIAQILVGHAASTIQRAHLSQLLDWRNEQLNVIAASTREITSALDPAEIFSALTKSAARLLKTPIAGIYEYDRQRQLLTVLSDSMQRYVGVQIRLGEGMAGQLVLTGAPHIIIPNYRNWEHRARIYESDAIYGAVLGVPLLWGTRCIGVLYVADSEGRAFQQSDADLLSTLAVHAASAVQQRIENDRRNLVLAVSRVVAECTDMADGLRKIADLLRTFMGSAMDSRAEPIRIGWAASSIS